jgi:hypothetical protein
MRTGRFSPRRFPVPTSRERKKSLLTEERVPSDPRKRREAETCSTQPLRSAFARCRFEEKRWEQTSDAISRKVLRAEAVPSLSDGREPLGGRLEPRDRDVVSVDRARGRRAVAVLDLEVAGLLRSHEGCRVRSREWMDSKVKEEGARRG